MAQANARKARLLIGIPIKSILLFGLPLFISNIINHLYGIADLAIVGKFLSSDDFAAVGATGNIVYFVFSTFWALCNGCAVVTAQRFGAGRERALRKSLTATFVIAFVTALLLMATVIPNIAAVLSLLETPTGIIFEGAKLYLLYLFWGLPITAVHNFVTSELRALGDSLTPTIFMIISAVLNVGLNYSFIVHFGMGVEGVAIATVAAQAVSTVGSLIVANKKFPFFTSPFKYWINSFRTYWQHLRIALPLALQFISIAVGFVTLQGALNSIGKVAINSYTVGVKTEQFLGTTLTALSVAVATFVAQNYGAGLFDRIKKGVIQSTFAAIGFTLLSVILMLLGPRIAVDVFLEEPEHEIYGIVSRYLFISAVFYICIGMLYVHRSMLQGLGYARILFICGLCELIARLSCSAYVFNIVKNAGDAGLTPLLRDNAFLAISLANPLSWLFAEIAVLVVFIPAYRNLGKGLSSFK